MRQWQTTLERWRSWHRGARWAVVILVLTGLSASAVILALPVLVRSALLERGQARGLSVEVGRVSLGRARIWIHNVLILDPLLPKSRVELGAIEIQLGFTGIRAVRLWGAQIRGVGSRQALQERWDALSPKSPTTATRSSSRRSWLFEARGLDGHFSDEAGRAIWFWGGAVLETHNGPVQAQLDLVHASLGAQRLELRSIKLSGIRTPVPSIQSFEATEGVVRLRLDRAQQEAKIAPIAVGGRAETKSGLMRSLQEVLKARLAAGFLGRVLALDTRLIRGNETLRVGPSQVTLSREQGGVRFEIAASPQPGAGTPLSLRARLPLDGPGGRLEVRGGPVNLAALGVQEGDFGLVGVRAARLAAKATVDWSSVTAPGTEQIQVTSEGQIENIRLRRPAVSSEELSGIQFGWQLAATAEPDQGTLQVQRASLLFDGVRAELQGRFAQSAEGTRFELSAEVPLASCSALLEALPDGAAPLLSGMKMGGTFSLKAQVQYDSLAPKTAEAALEVKNECRIATVPRNLSPGVFRKPWLREVQGLRGPEQIESGPGTPDWTPYEEISPYMETAILVCEDEGFFRHRGFAWRAIASSIEQNLAEGRFFRGGSTVSMQLAKNLYLGREKTLSRKIQEAVLTMLLEQELSKHELIELYLNVIEFGPGLYGIRQATRYYFDQEPHQLSLGQALYLASILPKPDSQHFAPDGRVTERWSAYLRKLMRIAHTIRRISDQELELGLLEQVAFRQPATMDGFQSTDDDEPPDPRIIEDR